MKLKIYVPCFLLNIIHLGCMLVGSEEITPACLSNRERTSTMRRKYDDAQSAMLKDFSKILCIKSVLWE